MKKCGWNRVMAVMIGTALCCGAMICANKFSPTAAVSAASETAASAKAPGATEDLAAVPSAINEQNSTAVEWNDNDVLPNGLSIGSIDLSGCTVAEARQKVSELGNQLLTRKITVTLNGKQYTSTAQDMGLAWTNANAVDEILTHVKKGSFVARYKNKKDLENNPVALSIQLDMPDENAQSYAQSIAKDAETAAVNSSITRTAEGNFQVSPSQTGIQFNAADIENQIITQLEDENHTNALELTTANIVLEPTVKEDAFANFKGDKLGSCTTNFKVNDKTLNRCSNIEVSANNMNASIIMPGDTASTLAMFEDVTVENGYSSAGTYLDGKVVDGIGGGICQTTTTLYDAVLASELGIVYRRNHSMLVDYVNPGMDATVDYDSKSDFKFKNNTDNPIYIESYRKDDTVTVTIYGTETRPANREVKYESVILEWSYPETESNPLFTYIVDPNLPIGWAPVSQKHYVEVDCHPQVKSEVYKNVYVDGVLTERTKLRETADKYRYSGGTIYYASDCRISAYDAQPDTANKRVISVDCTFKDGSPIGALPKE